MDQSQILKLMIYRGIRVKNPIPYNFNLGMVKEAREKNPVIIIGPPSHKKDALVTLIVALKIKKAGVFSINLLSIYPDCYGKVVYVDTMRSPVNPKDIVTLISNNKEVVIDVPNDLELRTATVGVTDYLIKSGYVLRKE